MYKAISITDSVKFWCVKNGWGPGESFLVARVKMVRKLMRWRTLAETAEFFFFVLVGLKKIHPSE